MAFLVIANDSVNLLPTINTDNPMAYRDYYSSLTTYEYRHPLFTSRHLKRLPPISRPQRMAYCEHICATDPGEGGKYCNCDNPI